MKKVFFFSAILVFGIIGIVWGRIIHIPDDYATIQEGINGSCNNDTVLVEPGMYYENIDFNSRRIILCSRFLIDGDTSSITTTIINGDSLDSVVKILDMADTAVAIIGFNIKCGRAASGGGILCHRSNPRIMWNKIHKNFSTSWNGGAGICCDSANATISFNEIYNNWADENGGGISCINSDPIISNNLIYKNRAYE